MTIWKESLTGDIWLVRVSGRLDQDQSSELESMLRELVDEGQINLLIDLSEVSYINSGGLRCLVTLWRQTRQDGGNLALCSLNSRLAEVFTIVGFDKVFDIYDDPASAQSDLLDE